MIRFRVLSTCSLFICMSSRQGDAVTRAVAAHSIAIGAQRKMSPEEPTMAQRTRTDAMLATPTILIAEDESAIADTIAYALRAEGHAAEHVLLGGAVVPRVQAGGIDLV